MPVSDYLAFKKGIVTTALSYQGIEAAVFGIKIGTYATAGRGVEHGDVGDVHDQHPSGIVFGSVIRP